MTSTYPCLRLEGGMIAGDVIDQIDSGELVGQKPENFGFPPGRTLIDEIAEAWNDSLATWKTYLHSLERQPEKDTSITRDRWMIPFFSLLGYELVRVPKAEIVDNLTFAFSHRAGPDPHAPPIHITGSKQSLNERPDSGTPRLAPHSLIQEYLNRTEELWGIVTNGMTLRLLRDSHLLRKQAYIEFDLRQMFEDQKFADFSLMFRLIHRSRLPIGREDVESCLLEQYHRLTVEQGGRVRDHLRDGVERAMLQFANGFIAHPKNADLRARIEAREIDGLVFYQQLLRLIYRLLFLMVSEERNLIIESDPDDRYRKYYSINRLRNLVEVRSAYSGNEDLWTSLLITFRLFSDEYLGPLLHVPTLNGDLFDTSRTVDLNSQALSNRDLLTGMWDLCMYQEVKKRGRRVVEKSPWRRINYAALDVEELGSVYESLLDFQPVFTTENGESRFELLAGTERKSTGSYYTPPELVNELIQSALVPTIQDRLLGKKSPAEREEALLSMSICDPACGSGHFLLAAARRIGGELARARSKEEEPSPDAFREAIRDVITHCIYGVDKNPLAVDLCKVALWLEGHTRAKPLTFLDHRIRCGDSLVGVFDLAVLDDGVPDDAYKALISDDKKVAQEIKKRNIEEKKAIEIQKLHQDLFSFDHSTEVISAIRERMLAIREDTPEGIKAKATAFRQYQTEGTVWCKDATACHLWTAAFFAELTKEKVQKVPTTETIREYLSGGGVDDAVRYSRELAGKYRFFHWPLEFPEVFSKGGFDCVLGNPPWKKTKIVDIGLPQFVTKFLKNSGRFPYASEGDMNTFSLFSEICCTNILSNTGRCGIIVKTGIVTDVNSRFLFIYLMSQQRIISIIDFVNTKLLFPDVASIERFTLFTTSGYTQKEKSTLCSFYNIDYSDLNDEKKRFNINFNEIQIINPNSNNCAAFLSDFDKILNLKIYSKNKIINNKVQKLNIWEIESLPIFHMTGDSQLFLDNYYERLVSDNISQNKFPILIRNSIKYYPLYEAKNISLYDFRYGTFDGVPLDKRFVKKAQPNRPSLSQKSDPNYCIHTRYWVDEKDFKKKISKHDKRKWIFVIRVITQLTSNARCSMGSLLPNYPLGHSLMSFAFNTENTEQPLIFCAIYNSFIFDYLLRQKIGGANITKTLFEQIATPDPNNIFGKCLVFYGKKERIDHFLLRRVLNLIWTSHLFDELGTQFENIEPGPYIWNEEERRKNLTEIDAVIAKLYGVNIQEYSYILDCFRILRDKYDIPKYGEYRTKNECLICYQNIELVE